MFKADSKSGWLIVTLGILFVALTARLVAITGDSSYFDNYALMMGVEKTFSEYSSPGSYSLPLYVYYWISYRVFGGSLFGYLVLPLMSSLATILVVYRGLRRYWYPAADVCFFTLAILVFNAHSLQLVSYAMFTYANSLLVSCCLFFIFLRLSTGKLTRRAWMWLTVGAIPAAFFSNLVIVIPVAAGVFSVVVFRWWQSTNLRDLKSVWLSLLEMWPLAIFPLTQLAVQILHPFTNLGADKRPDMSPLFFYSSEYSQNLWGGLQYVFNNAAKLFYGLLVPYPVGGDLMKPIRTFIAGGLTKPALIVTGVIVAAVTVGLIVRSFQRRLDHRATFTLVFVVVTFLAIATGGLAGLFPFGRARYADYLLIPVAVLIGYMAALVLQWITSRIAMLKNSNLLPVILATIIVISGSYFNWQEYQSNSVEKAEDAAAFQAIQDSHTDMVLYSSYIAPMLAVKLPDVYETASSIGWGKLYGQGLEGSAPDEVVKTLAGSSDVKSILIIAPSAELLMTEYSPWSDFLTVNFSEADSIKAPSIWVGYFVKK